MSVRPADMEERARLLAMSVAATSIADTAGFLTDLHKRIDESILRAVWVLPQIRKLSQSDDAFLSPQPPREDFAVAWPETLDVSAHASAQEALVECVVTLRARDPNLQKRVDRLVQSAYFVEFTLRAMGMDESQINAMRQFDGMWGE